MKRRDLLKLSALMGSIGPGRLLGSSESSPRRPLVISTWDHGTAANAAAWEILKTGGRALDAAEAGVMVTEADPDITTVGYGGMPDRKGHVTLDACIIDESGNCGSVAFLEHIKHPVSVARKVMELTPHVMLVGSGALEFALENGFQRENLLTPKAEQAWKQWLETGAYNPKINIENHDTIGLVALAADGTIAGACTTSGAAFKMHGRVGDSPIIGAGLYVDAAIGGACATGMGELVIKTVGTHAVVELMGRGLSPQEACESAVKTIAAKLPDFENFQVGFLAVNKDGEYGAFAIHPEFTYAVRGEDLTALYEAKSLL